MVARVALLVSIVLSTSASFAQLKSPEPARNSTKVIPVTRVLEAAAKATLEKDNIRVVLPLSAQAASDLKAVVWLASPKDMRYGEVTAAFSADGKSAMASLPWPKDTRGNNEVDIGWFRLCYRLEKEGIE